MTSSNVCFNVNINLTPLTKDSLVYTPRLFDFDTESTSLPPQSQATTPGSSDYATSDTIGSDWPTCMNTAALLGEEDPEKETEEAFICKERSRTSEYVFMHATPLQGSYACSRDRCAPLVKDGEHTALEGEEAEPEAEEPEEAEPEAEGPEEAEPEEAEGEEGKGEEAEGEEAEDGG